MENYDTIYFITKKAIEESMQSLHKKFLKYVNKKNKKLYIFCKFYGNYNEEKHALFVYLSGFHQVSYSFFIVFPIFAIMLQDEVLQERKLIIKDRSCESINNS